MSSATDLSLGHDDLSCPFAHPNLQGEGPKSASAHTMLRYLLFLRVFTCGRVIYWAFLLADVAGLLVPAAWSLSLHLLPLSHLIAYHLRHPFHVVFLLLSSIHLCLIFNFFLLSLQSMSLHVLGLLHIDILLPFDRIPVYFVDQIGLY